MVIQKMTQSARHWTTMKFPDRRRLLADNEDVNIHDNFFRARS